MSRLTIFLARLIGVFTLLLVAGLLLRGGATIAALVASAPAVFAFAIVSLAAGLAVVLGHNVWSGGALPVVVTLVGWAMLGKGVVLLLLPPDALSRMIERMHYGAHLYVYLVPALVLGLYLTWAGFTAPASRG
jgi:hypothetical protein